MVNKHYFSERASGKIFDGDVSVIDGEVMPVLTFCYNDGTWEELRAGASFIWDNRHYAPLQKPNDKTQAINAVEINDSENTLRMFNDKNEFDRFMTAYKKWLA